MEVIPKKENEIELDTSIVKEEYSVLDSVENLDDDDFSFVPVPTDSMNFVDFEIVDASTKEKKPEIKQEVKEEPIDEEVPEEKDKTLVKCLYCKRQCRKYLLQSHMDTTHSGIAIAYERGVKCTICHNFFENIYVLRDHIEEMHGKKTRNSQVKEESPKTGKKTSNKFQCNICKCKLPTFILFKRHLKTHELEETHQCSICSARFHCKSSLTKHKKLHERQLRIQERLEQEMKRKIENSRLAKELNRQSIVIKRKPTVMSEVSENRDIPVTVLFSCAHCKLEFKTLSGLQKHINGYCTVQRSSLTFNANADHKCPYCLKMVPLTKMSSHVNEHSSEERTFKCEICNKTFYSRVSLNHHKSYSHEKNSYHSCPICVRPFDSLADLEKHVKEHQSDFRRESDSVLHPPPDTSKLVEAKVMASRRKQTHRRIIMESEELRTWLIEKEEAKREEEKKEEATKKRQREGKSPETSSTLIVTKDLSEEIPVNIIYREDNS